MDETLGSTPSHKPSGEPSDEAGPRCDYLFRVLCSEDLRVEPSAHALVDIDEVELVRGERWEAHRQGRRLTLQLADARVSALHARLTRGPGGWVIEDLRSRNGTRRAVERVERAMLRDSDVCEVGRTFLYFRRGFLMSEPVDRGPSGVGMLRTLSPSFATALAPLEQVATTDVPVHLSGETGTGKELAARALHAASGRHGPLVAVNCGALAPTLLESELFGHRRGAFSGALEDRPGLVRSAHGGTLFLDEVTDLSPAAQTALLRVLQEREVLPVGGTRALPVDVRFCSAANRPLDEAIRTGRLRADLVARLFGFRLRLPPLRERREDLGLVCAVLLGRIAGPEASRVRLSREAARAFLAAPWPLNVRALEHALATAWALGRAEGTLTLAHFGDTVAAFADPSVLPTTASAAPEPGAPPAELADARAVELEALLKAHGGNLTAVARALGRDRALVRRWLRRYQLDPDRYRG